jgi:dihydrofolate synthase/folylpolyglutamate synthase
MPPASEIIDGILQNPKFGSGIGFRRLFALLNPLLESPWGQRFSTIKITGSNGKGSVAALVHSVLRHLGVNCGRHTSPHLVSFNERIVLGDEDITDAQLEGAFAPLSVALERVARDVPDEKFGSFEIITALCLHAFANADIAVGVMEAGIGGRYDPHRMLPGDLVALTSVDLEHTDLLGPTRELIGYDKLDLCPDGGTVVSVNRDADLWARLSAYCWLRRIALVDARELWSVEVAAAGSEPGQMNVRLTSRNGLRLDVATPLVGTFQLDNIAIACALVELWARRHLPGLALEHLAGALATGLRSVRWPGRFELISTNPPVIIDVGHSPDACARVVESVRTFLAHRPVLLVTGVSADKAVEEMVRTLVPVAHGIICTRAYHKGESVQRIAGLVRCFAPSTELWEAGTIEEAAALARQLAGARDLTVLVAGGLFLAIEFRTAYSGSDPRRLRFY